MTLKFTTITKETKLNYVKIKNERNFESNPKR